MQNLNRQMRKGKAISESQILKKGVVPLDTEQDLVVFTDDDGNELTLEVLDYFFYNGKEYAVLSDVEDELDDCEDCAAGCHACSDDSCEHDHPEKNLYIMQVIAVEDDQEEFVPVEDKLLDKLIEVVQTRFEEEMDFEGEDSDAE